MVDYADISYILREEVKSASRNTTSTTGKSKENSSFFEQLSEKFSKLSEIFFNGFKNNLEIPNISF